MSVILNVAFVVLSTAGTARFASEYVSFVVALLVSTQFSDLKIRLHS